MFRPINAPYFGAFGMGQASSQVNEPTAAIGQIQHSQENLPVSEVEMQNGGYDKNVELREDEQSNEMEMENLADSSIKKSKKRKRSSMKAADHQVETHRSEPDQQNAKKRKHKSRRSIYSQEQSEKEIEDGHALMNLSNRGRDEGSPAIYEDDIAASAQLLRESSPALCATDVEAAEPHNLSSQAKKPRKKTRKSRKMSKSDEKGPNTLVDISETNEGDSCLVDRISRSSYLPTPSAEHTEFPQPTLSLDDIDSNDEAVAPLLDEYQTQMSPPKSSSMGLDELFEDPDEREDLSLAPPGDGISAANSDVEVPPNSSPLRSIAITKDKGVKGQRHTEAVLGIEQENSNRITNELGQWNSEYAFDDQSGDLWPFNLDLADDSQYFTVDPLLDSQHLNHDGYSVSQLENQNCSNLDSPELSHVKVGKLKRVSSRQRKQKHPTLRNAPDDLPTQEPSNKRVSDVLHNERVSDVLQNETQSHALSDVEGSHSQMSKTQGAGLKKNTAKQPKRRHTASNNEKPPSQSKPHFPSPHFLSTYDPDIGDLAKKGGMFTAKERKILCDFQKAYCAEHNITPYQFAADRVHANAHNNGNLNSFWSELCDTLPYRTRQSIQRFCRRQFHVYEKRGIWTEEEDQALLDAIELKGKSWVAVGQICDRLAEDCRDRYRNHLHNAEKRNKDQWTDQEVKELCRAVGECIYLMREEKRQLRELELNMGDDLDQAEDDEEKFINWQIVSEKMDGVRSRLQCNYKWKSLKNSDRDLYIRQIKLAKKTMAVLEEDGTIDIFTSQDKPRKNGWRYKGAQKKVQESMSPRDKYDILNAVINCGALEETSITWSKLGKGETWRDKWETIDCKVAWERMRKGQEIEGGYVEVARKLLEEFVEREGGSLGERWEPGTQARTTPEGKKQRKKKDRKKKENGDADANVDSTKRKRKNQTLSSVIIIDSSDEAGADKGAENVENTNNSFFSDDPTTDNDVDEEEEIILPYAPGTEPSVQPSFPNGHHYEADDNSLAIQHETPAAEPENDDERLMRLLKGAL